MLFSTEHFRTIVSTLVRPPSPQKNESDLEKGRLCHIVPDYRTFIDDYLKILDFIDWLKVAYPEKAKFLTEKSSG